LWAKVQIQESDEGSNFDNYSDFSDERPMVCQNFVGQSSKTTKLCVKSPKIMGLSYFGEGGEKLHFVLHKRPPIFFAFLQDF